MYILNFTGIYKTLSENIISARLKWKWFMNHSSTPCTPSTSAPAHTHMQRISSPSWGKLIAQSHTMTSIPSVLCPAVEPAVLLHQHLLLLQRGWRPSVRESAGSWPLWGQRIVAYDQGWVGMTHASKRLDPCPNEYLKNKMDTWRLPAFFEAFEVWQHIDIVKIWTPSDSFGKGFSD